MEEEELQESTERAFHTYVKPLEAVTSFKYLGGVITTGEDNWPAVVGNLRNAWKIWARLARILGREGEDLKVSGMLFKVVFQAVFIFWSEM